MISIAICTYNGERYIQEQLKSIIRQTVLPNEIILCDDCSNDRTVEYAKEILEVSGIEYKIIINEVNIGFVKNFEKAINHTHGDIIFLSDQDDVWLENKIEKIISYFNDSSILLVHHNCILTDAKLQTELHSYWKCVNINVAQFNEMVYDSLLISNCVQGSACAFRRVLFDMSAPFPERACHDEWMALVAMCKGRMYAVESPLMQYRQWGKNTIGAEAVGPVEKVLKYMFNLQAQLKRHVEELVRRENIFSILMQRGFKSNNIQVTLDFVDTMLLERLNLIYHKRRNIPFRKYFFMFNIMMAFKQISKDVLSRIFYKYKCQ